MVKARQLKSIQIRMTARGRRDGIPPFRGRGFPPRGKWCKGTVRGGLLRRLFAKRAHGAGRAVALQRRVIELDAYVADKFVVPIQFKGTLGPEQGAGRARGTVRISP